MGRGGCGSRGILWILLFTHCISTGRCRLDVGWHGGMQGCWCERDLNIEKYVAPVPSHAYCTVTATAPPLHLHLHLWAGDNVTKSYTIFSTGLWDIIINNVIHRLALVEILCHWHHKIIKNFLTFVNFRINYLCNYLWNDNSLRKLNWNLWRFFFILKLVRIFSFSFQVPGKCAIVQWLWKWDAITVIFSVTPPHTTLQTTLISWSRQGWPQIMENLNILNSRR